MNGSPSEVLETDLEGDADAEPAWAAEIERRLARNEAGESRLLGKDEAMQRLRRAIPGR
jgi:hypothetical protein